MVVLDTIQDASFYLAVADYDNQKHEDNKYYILNDFEHIIDFIKFVKSRDGNRILFYES